MICWSYLQFMAKTTGSFLQYIAVEINENLFGYLWGQKCTILNIFASGFWGQKYPKWCSFLHQKLSAYGYFSIFWFSFPPCLRQYLKVAQICFIFFNMQVIFIENIIAISSYSYKHLRYVEYKQTMLHQGFISYHKFLLYVNQCISLWYYVQ